MINWLGAVHMDSVSAITVYADRTGHCKQRLDPEGGKLRTVPGSHRHKSNKKTKQKKPGNNFLFQQGILMKSYQLMYQIKHKTKNNNSHAFI